jgi:hypothetical protein
LNNTIPENQNRTYENLSQEFKELYPMARRAFDLIPMMYNRLTLIDKMSHGEAITKIYQDHIDLEGFSRRNIYRYLPSDNPNVQRRVVPSQHNSGNAKLESNNMKFDSDTDTDSDTDRDRGHFKENILSDNSQSCPQLRQINRELNDAHSSRPVAAASDFIPDTKRFTIPKERHANMVEEINKSKDFICLEFNNQNQLVSVTADIIVSKSVN